MKSPEVFYLHIDGAQRGPYTIQHIDHLLHSGLIAEETTFWREGLDQWQPVTDLVPRRRAGRRWIKPAVIVAMVLAVVVFARVFGPTTIMGWRELNQHAFTENAAYWRARGVVRQQLAEHGIIQFTSSKSARVELHAPDRAAVTLRGQVTDSGGRKRPAQWAVDMHFNQRTKEWRAVTAQEVSPQT